MQNNVVYLPVLYEGMYEPDHWEYRRRWRQKRGWETAPVRPPYQPEELVEHYQARANRLTKQLKEAPLLALAYRPWLMEVNR